jgi:hypothetical protein
MCTVHIGIEQSLLVSHIHVFLSLLPPPKKTWKRKNEPEKINAKPDAIMNQNALAFCLAFVRKMR